jgi:cytochrome c peroxidase
MRVAVWLSLVLSGLLLDFGFSMAADHYAGAERNALALERIDKPSLGLPPAPFPENNPPTTAKIRLGRKLFLDRRLSHNGTISCAMCHVPEQGFSVNEIATAVGNEGKSLRRNAPTLLNVAFMGPIFHDGRETSLETQVISPLLDAEEMGNPSIGYLIERIRRMDDYDGMFESAFGRKASIETLGQAIATYQRTLISANSAFDRWYIDGESDALTEEEKEGFNLFTGRAGCVKCHTVTREYVLFHDQSFHDTGVGWYKSMIQPAEGRSVRVRLAPGVFTTISREVVDSVGLPGKKDLGRYEITRDPADLLRFKTPTLRNIALTAPYMHDGSLSTLPEVVAFYNRGGYPHDNLDPLIKPLGLSDEEMDALVTFLHSLTGNNLRDLVEDARSEIIGNPGETFKMVHE